MLKRMIKKMLAIMIIASMIFTSHAFVVFAEGVNANNEETVEETSEKASEEVLDEKEEESVEEETEESLDEVKEETSEEETLEKEEDVNPTEEKIENEDSNVSPDLEEEETKATDYAEEPEDDIAEEETESTGSGELESKEEETESTSSGELESKEEETESTSSGELASQEEETTTEESVEEVPLDLGTPEEKVVDDQITGLYSNLKFTYDRFKTGSKKIFFMFNSKLWEIADDYSDPDAMWQLDTTSSTATSQSLYVLTYVCNYEKFADGTYSIDDFEFPTVVSVGYGYDENGECWAENDVTQKPAYSPIMAPGAVTYNYFDDFDFSTISASDQALYGDTLREWFKNRCLDDYYGDNTFRSAPGGGAGNLTLVIGNGLTSMNSEAAYYIPLYLDAEARNERFNRIVEDLKSRFGDDVYIRGLAGGVGKAKTFNTSTIVQDATAVAHLFPDEYESRILNETSSSKYFLVFGFTSRDAGKTYRLGVDERFGHFTNETGIDEEGYFTYTYQSRETDIIVPTIENHKNGISFNTTFKNPDTGGTVTASEASLINSLNSWLKTKGSAWNSQTFMAEFGGSFFHFRFNNASHLTKTGTLDYAPKNLFDIVPPTIQKYNGSHYIFDKWLDADGNEITDINEFVAAFIDNPVAHTDAYAYEKLIEEKIIFDMSDFTEDMGTYEGDTEFYLDETNLVPPTINCNPDYSFVGWSKEKYATALVTLEEITAEIEEWKENPSGNKVYYPVFRGKPMLRYTLDTTKGTVTDMPYGKLAFKYDEMTSLDLFQARPEINGNFGYNFIGWNINSQYVELDDVANIIDTWAFDPDDDLVLEAAFESVGTLTLNIDTTKIEIADDPTGIQEANQIKLDGKTYAWPNITFNTIDDDIVFLGFGTGDNLIIPIDEIDAEYPGLMNQREDLVYDTIYRNKFRFTFNTTGIEGKGSIAGTLSFKEDESGSILEPTVTDNDDYEFLGWTKDTTTNNIISVSDAIGDWSLESDYNLYPVFKTLYNVVYAVRTEDTNKATIDFTGLTYEYKMPKQALTNTAAVSNIINGKPNSGITRNIGYKLAGWLLNGELVTTESLAQSINTATSDIYLYAKFEELPILTLTLDLDKINLQGDATSELIILDSESEWPNHQFTVVDNTLVFLGFADNNNIILSNNNLANDFNAWKNNEPATLILNAMFRNKAKFVFSPEAFEGKGTMGGETVFFEDESVVAPTIDTNEFYEFLGWTNNTMTNITIEVADAENEWDRINDYVLYPVFRRLWKVSYKVLDSDLDKANVDFTNLTHEFKVNVSATDIYNAKPDSGITRKHGYNFIGWELNGEDLSVEVIEEAVANADGDIEILARFTALPLFRINIDTSHAVINGNESATYIELDALDDYDAVVFNNVANSGKKFIGFGSGTTVYVNPDGLEEAFTNWKNSANNINVIYDTIARDLNTFNVEVDTKYLNVSGSQVITEDANADTQVITLPTIVARPGYIFNNEYSLTVDGEALTADELNALITAWDGESNVTLYALHEDDPDANRVIINIDKNKGQHANVPGGSLTIFEVAEFDNLKALITSITSKPNYEFKNWKAGANEYAELAEIDWDGTSNLTIEAVFKQKTKSSGNNGGGKSSGGSGGYGGMGRGNEVSKEGFGPGSQLAGAEKNEGGRTSMSLIFIEPLHHEEIPHKVENVPISSKEQLIISESDKDIKNYAWMREDGNYKLYNVLTNKCFVDGWVYAENAGEYDWYHFDSNGNMSTGWIQDGELLYYLNTDPSGRIGAMITGTKLIDGKMSVFSDNGFLISQY